MAKNKTWNFLRYAGSNILTMIGIVLIWRGIWYLLDVIDDSLFGGPNWMTALAGVLAGVLCLYLPDKDLKEIEKL